MDRRLVTIVVGAIAASLLTAGATAADYKVLDNPDVEPEVRVDIGPRVIQVPSRPRPYLPPEPPPEPRPDSAPAPPLNLLPPSPRPPTAEQTPLPPQPYESPWCMVAAPPDPYQPPWQYPALNVRQWPYGPVLGFILNGTLVQRVPAPILLDENGQPWAMAATLVGVGWVYRPYLNCPLVQP